MHRKSLIFLMVWSLGLYIPLVSTGCQLRPADGHTLRVLAVETFLADIAQNVAGGRVKVQALMPLGADPHSFEPTPKDVVQVADSDVLIVNGAGFEEFLKPLLQNAGGKRLMIEASAGLTTRAPGPGETAREGDPHFFMNPIDAAARGIENNDTVKITSPEGSSIRRVLVTERIMPGVTSLPHGAWTEFDDNLGVDKAGSDNFLEAGIALGEGNFGYNSQMVQVEKWNGPALQPDSHWPQRIPIEEA